VFVKDIQSSHYNVYIVNLIMNSVKLLCSQRVVNRENISEIYVNKYFECKSSKSMKSNCKIYQKPSQWLNFCNKNKRTSTNQQKYIKSPTVNRILKTRLYTHNLSFRSLHTGLWQCSMFFVRAGSSDTSFSGSG